MKGFTLIELLVVVLIIGILASVALPQYTKAVERARTAEALSITKSVQNAIDVYGLATGYVSSQTFMGVAPAGGYMSNGELDLDLDKTLQCSKDDMSCESKHFTYFAWCDGAWCAVGAIRGKCAPGACTPPYTLVKEKAFGNTWRSTCFACEANGDIGHTVCKGLEGQGWVYNSGCET